MGGGICFFLLIESISLLSLLTEPAKKFTKVVLAGRVASETSFSEEEAPHK